MGKSNGFEFGRCGFNPRVQANISSNKLFTFWGLCIYFYLSSIYLCCKRRDSQAIFVSIVYWDKCFPLSIRSQTSKTAHFLLQILKSKSSIADVYKREKRGKVYKELSCCWTGRWGKRGTRYSKCLTQQFSKLRLGKNGWATERLGFIRFFFFFNSIGKTKIQLGKPKTPAKKEELNEPW